MTTVVKELNKLAEKITGENPKATTDKQALDFIADYFAEKNLDPITNAQAIEFISDNYTGGGGGVTPTGTINITENGETDVTNYATANVAVPGPTGTINISANGTVNVSEYATASVAIYSGQSVDYFVDLDKEEEGYTELTDSDNITAVSNFISALYTDYRVPSLKFKYQGETVTGLSAMKMDLDYGTQYTEFIIGYNGSCSIEFTYQYDGDDTTMELNWYSY